MTTTLSAPGALAEAYRTHGHMVVRRARHIVGNVDDAQDIAHEVFASLVARPGQFEGRSALSTFLYTATTHLALRRLRDRSRRATLTELFVRPVARSAVDALGEQLAVLRDVLGRLPPELAAVGVHIYIDEMTHDEVAGILGCSRRTVGNLLLRFHERARAVIGAGDSVDDAEPINSDVSARVVSGEET